MSNSTSTRSRPNYWLSAIALLGFSVVFLFPFAFILLTAAKSQQDSALLHFSWPSSWHLVQNLKDVLAARNYIMIVAFINSTVITVGNGTEGFVDVLGEFR